MTKTVSLRRKPVMEVRDRHPKEYWRQKQYEVPSVGDVLVVNEDSTYWAKKKGYVNWNDTVWDRMPKRFVCKVTDTSSRFIIVVDEQTPSGLMVSKSYLRKDFIYGFLRYVVVDDHMLLEPHIYPMLDFDSEIVKQATIKKQRLVKVVDLN